MKKLFANNFRFNVPLSCHGVKWLHDQRSDQPTNNQRQHMKNKVLLLALALSASTSLLLAQDATPPADGQQPPAGEHGPRGSRGWVHILPPGADQRLDLTDDQRKQIADLEADVKTKLEKILTSEQIGKLKKLHPQRGQGGGPGGPGGNGGPEGGPGDGPQGGPDGGPAGPGGQGGPGGPGGDPQQ